MQTGWQGNKTEMIERGERSKVEMLDRVTPESLHKASKEVIEANKAFEKSRKKGKQPDTPRVDRAYAYLNALIERAAKEGVSCN